ncbi:rubrerythrin family protein [Peptoniphilus sp. GNH]|nr:rubrerythrin [Clostridiales bacterium KA00134]UHR02277.1 rubrerythrin family protein [Peptoniphilus sp. GNH]
MAKNLKGTQTAINLMKSFAGECQANRRYTFYAKQAEKDGYIQIRDIFTETARNESEHAKRFFKFLQAGGFGGETIEITSSFPVELTDTKANLKAAAAGENEEATSMYPEFAKVAKEEGFEDIAKAFTEIGEVEEAHEERYLKLLKNIEEGKVFERDEVVRWHCLNCGYIHEGKSAPEVCPACAHPQKYFELWVEAY